MRLRCSWIPSKGGKFPSFRTLAVKGGRAACHQSVKLITIVNGEILKLGLLDSTQGSTVRVHLVSSPFSCDTPMLKARDLPFPV